MLVCMQATNHIDDDGAWSGEPWGVRPLVWGLRMLGDAPGFALGAYEPNDRYAIARFLGIPPPVGTLDDAAAARLDRLLAVRRRELHRAACASVLDDNLALLRTALGLNATELGVIAFRAMLHSHPGFDAIASKYVGLCPDFVFHGRLASLLGVSTAAVAGALASSSALMHSGLISVETGILGPLTDRLKLVPGLVSPLMTPHVSGRALLEALLPPVRSARLDLSAYPHMAQEVALTRGYLVGAVQSHACGRNVLLWGEPGTGKTELSAALAAAVDCPLYASEGVFDDCTPLTPRLRLARLGQVQKLAKATGGGLVLADEAEDLFPLPWSNLERVPTKAALNECLETNVTPTIWISNRTEHIDTAFLRRFDVVLHVLAPPARTLRALLRHALPRDVLSDAELHRYANEPRLTPAVVNRLASVATAVAKSDANAANANLRMLSEQYLQVTGGKTLQQGGIPLEHDARLLNTDPPVSELLDRIDANTRCGVRMLFHGAPGTGKSALAKVLAERLDKRLVCRRASSLLSKWVGETEQNLAAMFDDVRRDGAVLLLDEVDSFLRGRDRGATGWEITQVNELLTQMEAFDGVLLCTTNRVEELDPAALRRFDFKIAFKPLLPEQRVQLVEACLLALGANDAGGSWRDRALALDGLTPGDAAAAMRPLRFASGRVTADNVLEALARECRYKPAAARPIGFMQ